MEKSKIDRSIERRDIFWKHFLKAYNVKAQSTPGYYKMFDKKTGKKIGEISVFLNRVKIEFSL